MSMASLKPDFFGWEMLYKSIERAIIRKTDILIALTHFVLLKYGGFHCLGIGEDETLLPHEIGFELLPDGWNYDGDKYALRYIHDFSIYLLTGIKTEEGFVIRLYSALNEKDSNIKFDAEAMVDKIRGSITDLVPKASQVAEKIRKELIDPVFPSSTREITTQTNPNDSQMCQSPDEEKDLAQSFHCLSISDPKPFMFNCASAKSKQ